MSLTPYDTGERLEPHPWVHKGRAGSYGQREAEDTDYGRVDFDDDVAATLFTVWGERTDDGEFRLHVEGNALEALTIITHGLNIDLKLEDQDE